MHTWTSKTPSWTSKGGYGTSVSNTLRRHKAGGRISQTALDREAISAYPNSAEDVVIMRDRGGSLNVPFPHRQSPYALATLPPTPRKRSTPEGVSAMVEY
jgi:hypothetical protein